MDTDPTPTRGASASAVPADPPPRDYDVPSSFKYDQEMVDKIASTLCVHPQYVIQGCFYSSLGREAEPLENDEVMAWVLENHSRFVEIHSSNDEAEMEDDSSCSDAELKMVIVVNEDLSMSPGKMAAQVAHGALELYASLTQDAKYLEVVQQWMTNGAKKVVLRCKDAEALFDLRADAEDEGIRYAQIADAGRTQVAAGSVTCLAVFGPSGKVNKVTGNLPLLT